MGLLEPYVGRYVTAASAMGDIDAPTIMSGCSQLAGAASEFTSIGSKMNNAASICNDKALMVSGQTMGAVIADNAEGIASFSGQISALASEAASIAEMKYNEIQQKYNDIAKAQDAEIARQKEEEEAKKKK